jgi:hypothetical protein
LSWSVFVVTSQPLAGSWSQSPVPIAQVQVPALHDCPTAQRVVQSPQCIVSAETIASQPFAGLPSQSAVPGAQAHVPAWHVRPIGHMCPHMPQLALSVAAFTSQPFTTLPSQSRNPVRHELVHDPPLHVVPTHAIPHSPQFAGSWSRFTHALPQQVSGAEQLVQDPESWPSWGASAPRVSPGTSTAASMDASWASPWNSGRCLGSQSKKQFVVSRAIVSSAKTR